MLILVADVSVSIPTVLMVAEGNGMVDVCATLSAKQIEKPITFRLFSSKITMISYGFNCR